VKEVDIALDDDVEVIAFCAGMAMANWVPGALEYPPDRELYIVQVLVAFW